MQNHELYKSIFFVNIFRYFAIAPEI
jgi:hypothetical protein